MASAPPPASEAAQLRIIAHMNSDHQRELSHYLRHWGSLSASAASRPSLRAISFSAMAIATRDGRVHTVPVEPPMGSWADARPRAVAMAAEARAALGIADVVVDRYAPPRRPLHLGAFALCLAVYASFVLRPWMAPGSFFDERVLCYFPGGQEAFLWVQGKIMLPMLAIHVAECVLLQRWRLTKYDVGGSVWWMWMASCFVEGFGAFQRVEEIANEKREKAQNKKH